MEAQIEPEEQAGWQKQAALFRQRRTGRTLPLLVTLDQTRRLQRAKQERWEEDVAAVEAACGLGRGLTMGCGIRGNRNHPGGQHAIHYEKVVGPVMRAVRGVAPQLAPMILAVMDAAEVPVHEDYLARLAKKLHPEIVGRYETDHLAVAVSLETMKRMGTIRLSRHPHCWQRGSVAPA